MRRLFAVVLALLALTAAGRAQGLDQATYQECTAACDAATDACCVPSCGYRACIAGAAGGASPFSPLSGIGLQTGGADTGAAQAAVAVCMPHVDAIQRCRAEEARTGAALPPAAPAPVPFIALDCCRYWLEPAGGKTVVRGWYRGAAGQRIDYRSEPVHPMSLAGTAAGMFALTNGVGYHVYWVDEGNPGLAGGLVYVTRFGAERVENLYILRIGGRFYLRLADDMSSGKVVYSTAEAPDAFYELPLK